MSTKVIIIIIGIISTIMLNGCIWKYFSNNQDNNNFKSDFSTLSDISVRKLSVNSKIGDRIIFGVYNQNGDLKNNEPIIWRILEIKEKEALLISEYCIDCLPFDSGDVENINWGKSTLRIWLNNDFYRSSFSDEEKVKISKKLISNDMNPEFLIGGSEDTLDMVFLLSIYEVQTLFSSDNDRRSIATDYAKEKGVYVYKNNLCDWWLRSNGGYKFTIATVGANGTIFNMGNPYSSYDKGIRPAIRVKIE